MHDIFQLEIAMVQFMLQFVGWLVDCAVCVDSQIPPTIIHLTMHLQISIRLKSPKTRLPFRLIYLRFFVSADLLSHDVV
jgi:hypothetical protein